MSVTFNPKVRWGRKPLERQQIVLELFNQFGMLVTRKQVLSYVGSSSRWTKHDVDWLLNGLQYRRQRGSYTLSPLFEVVHDVVNANQ